jgi:hypothetical protein
VKVVAFYILVAVLLLGIEAVTVAFFAAGVVVAAFSAS